MEFRKTSASRLCPTQNIYFFSKLAVNTMQYWRFEIGINLCCSQSEVGLAIKLKSKNKQLV